MSEFVDVLIKCMSRFIHYYGNIDTEGRFIVFLQVQNKTNLPVP